MGPRCGPPNRSRHRPNTLRPNPRALPGHKFLGTADQITCKGCLKSIDSRRNAEINRQRWERERQQAQAEHDQQEERWWAYYADYLDNHPAWQKKRRLVLQRSNGWCEGCWERRAVQVHHRPGTYPKNCIPGSQEGIRKEKLFDLIPLCNICHHDVHDD